jgi:hypothetical protein
MNKCIVDSCSTQEAAVAFTTLLVDCGVTVCLWISRHPYDAVHLTAIATCFQTKDFPANQLPFPYNGFALATASGSGSGSSSGNSTTGGNST